MAHVEMRELTPLERLHQQKAEAEARMRDASAVLDPLVVARQEREAATAELRATEQAIQAEEHRLALEAMLARYGPMRERVQGLRVEAREKLAALVAFLDEQLLPQAWDLNRLHHEVERAGGQVPPFPVRQWGAADVIASMLGEIVAERRVGHRSFSIHTGARAS